LGICNQSGSVRPLGLKLPNIVGRKGLKALLQSDRLVQIDGTASGGFCLRLANVGIYLKLYYDI